MNFRVGTFRTQYVFKGGYFVPNTRKYGGSLHLKKGGHFVPNRGDISYPIPSKKEAEKCIIMPCQTHICAQCILCPPKWYFLNDYFLNGAAQSPRPLPHGYAAVRRPKDLAIARTVWGNPSRGVPPNPLPPKAQRSSFVVSSLVLSRFARCAPGRQPLTFDRWASGRCAHLNR